MIQASSEIDEEITGDRLQHDFKQLEKSTGAASADSQLLALKQRMGLLPAGSAAEPRKLGAGAAPDEETVHADIEDDHSEKH
jgi:phage shock protein A